MKLDAAVGPAGIERLRNGSAVQVADWGHRVQTAAGGDEERQGHDDQRHAVEPIEDGVAPPSEGADRDRNRGSDERAGELRAHGARDEPGEESGAG